VNNALQAAARHASQLFSMKFFYVYILQSENNAKHFYIGFTENLRDRLRVHNAGHVPHTVKFRPWRIKTAIAFIERQRAIEFECYLKTASGRAFAKKRF
jgi:predicted GIY-YIG superfamily endonuclease